MKVSIISMTAPRIDIQESVSNTFEVPLHPPMTYTIISRENRHFEMQINVLNGEILTEVLKEIFKEEIEFI